MEFTVGIPCPLIKSDVQAFMALKASGYHLIDISNVMCLSKRTIERYYTRVIDAFKARNLYHAIAIALHNKWIIPIA